MKLGLMFMAGLLAGVAVGLLFGEFGGGRDRDGGGGGEWEAGGGSYGDGGSGRGWGSKGSRPGRSGKGEGKIGAGNSPAGAEDLLGYLADLTKVDEVEEVNFMELIRRAHEITIMSEAEVVALLEVLREAKAEGGDEEELNQIFGGILFARLAELNGPEAMRMALAGEMGGEWEHDEETLVALGLTAWVGADPRGAEAWFRNAAESDPKFREMLKDRDLGAAFFGAMARADGERARRLLQDVGGLARAGAEAVARHVESVEGLRSLLETTSGDSRGEVFEVMSERNPAAAKEWLEAQAGFEDRWGYVEVLGRRLLAEDPAAGAEWFMAQELPEERQSQRYLDIVAEWVNRDPSAAQEWLSGQADSPQRDTAEMVMAMNLASNHGDWEGGIAWAARVGDEKQRGQAVERILDEGRDGSPGVVLAEVAEAARAAGFGLELDRYVERHRSQPVR